MSETQAVIASDDDILTRYHTIRDIGRMMRQHAQASEWDSLVALQTRYVAAFEALAEVEEAVVLSEVNNSEKATLLVEIQQAENVIRQCLNARLEELSEIIGEARHRKTAVRSYQKQGAS